MLIESRTTCIQLSFPLKGAIGVSEAQPSRLLLTPNFRKIPRSAVKRKLVAGELASDD
jgi:hypothetical protein